MERSAPRSGIDGAITPTFVACFDLEVGDRVRWTVRAPGTRERRGTVVAVVPAGAMASAVVPAGLTPPRRGYGQPRPWRTFLIRLRGGSIAYWPQTRTMVRDEV